MARLYAAIKDTPDIRDHVTAPPAAPIRASVDLRPQMSPIRDQQSEGACHDADTEVLTEQGWKHFAELRGFERLATVNPATSELSYERPTRLIRYPYNGPLICAENQSLNFAVTPNHQMLVRRWNEQKRTLNSEYEFVEAAKLGWYSGLLNRVKWGGEGQRLVFYTLPGTPSQTRSCQREPRDIPMSSWLRFLGIYIAEGTMLKRDQNKKYVSYKVQIAGVKDREREFIRAALREIGVNALELEDRFVFSNRQVYEAMSQLGLEGIKAAEKFVPEFVFGLNADLIGEFLAGHAAGDGYLIDGARQIYGTSSAQLADDLQRLVFLSGQETRISVREARVSMQANGRTIVGQYPERRVSVCEKKNLSIERKESIFTRQYDGEVFCAEVSTHHTLVTRRCGKILISGNCTMFAGTAIMSWLWKKFKGEDLVFSPQFGYRAERLVEGDPSVDGGAQSRTMMAVMHDTGLCLEATDPYTDKGWKNPTTKEMLAEAQKYRIGAYHRVPDVDTAKSVLSSGYPTSIAITVYQSFEDVADARMSSVPGRIPIPNTAKEKILGGHEMVLVGYDEASRVFIVRNSWSELWGDEGYGYLPFSYPYIDDMWTCHFGSAWK